MSLLSWLEKPGESSKSSVTRTDQPEKQSNVEQIAPEPISGTSAVQKAPGITPQPDAALIPESPHQPVLLSFPLRKFGDQQRAFSASWYHKYPWLHYQEGNDNVLCFYCMVADKRGLPVSCNKDDALSKTGFNNWKKALERFEKHQNTTSHRDAVDLVVKIPSTTKDVGEMLSAGLASQKAESRKVLLTILSSIRYLGRQGLALRGRYKTADSSDKKGGEIDSNFIQLLRTRAEDNPGILKWMDKAQNKFTSPDIQNEMLGIMALHILRDVSSEISGKWYTIMVDETTDLSNTEQLICCLRYVDSDLEVHEEVIGLYSLDSTSAEMITATIEDVLLCLNLRIDNCRGQCYDGASSMSGAKSGVAARLTALEAKAVYTHCYGHALNLAAQDAIRGLKIMGDALDTVYEITKLIKKSPKRDVLFQKVKDDVTPGSPGVRILCPTRWTVRAEALSSIAENYQALQMTWDAAKEATRDSEMRARIGGVAAQMEKFDFFFGVELGRKILNMADNLSRSLQEKCISACEGQKLISLTLATFQSIRSDECFDLFWDYVEGRRSMVDVSSPSLPRQRKVPRRFEDGEGAPEYPRTAKDYYRRIYFEGIDLITSAIRNRFEQKGFQILQKLETALTTIEQPQRSEALKEVISFYGTDFQSEDRLQTQLTCLHSGSGNSLTDLQSIVTYLKSLSTPQKEYFCEVVKLVKLILVMPATNAQSERSFSALRRLKTWLRTTTSQAWLNWCMILHVHQERTDALPMLSVANEFVTRSDNRMRIFG